MIKNNLKSDFFKMIMRKGKKTMKTASIHIGHTKANFKHNDRTNINHDNIHKERLSLNYCDKPSTQTLKELKELYRQAMECKKGKKGKRAKFENSYKEAILELPTAPADELYPIVKTIAKEVGEILKSEPIQIAIHRDEGHFNEHGEFQEHTHAHIIFFTLNKETAYQNANLFGTFNKKNLSKIQKIAYEHLKEYGLNPPKANKETYFKDYRQYKLFKKKEQEFKEWEQDLINRQKTFNSEIDDILADFKKIIAISENKVEFYKNAYEKALESLENDAKAVYKKFIEQLKKEQEQEQEQNPLNADIKELINEFEALEPPKKSFLNLNKAEIERFEKSKRLFIKLAKLHNLQISREFQDFLRIKKQKEQEQKQKEQERLEQELYQQRQRQLQQDFLELSERLKRFENDDFYRSEIKKMEHKDIAIKILMLSDLEQKLIEKEQKEQTEQNNYNFLREKLENSKKQEKPSYTADDSYTDEYSKIRKRK